MHKYFIDNLLGVHCTGYSQIAYVYVTFLAVE